MKSDFDNRSTESRQAYDNVFIRKGSIAAFIAAMRRYDAASPDTPEAVRAAADLAALLPAMVSLGLFELFSVKSSRGRALLRSFDPTLPL